MTTLPVVVLDHLTPTQRRALVITDNQLALKAGWDEELLRLELADLKLADFDLSITGFDPDELDDLLAPEETTAEGQTDDDVAPKVPEQPISRPDDLWVLCHHRLLCCDATREEDYRILLGDERVAMLWQDPPYNVDYANSAKDKLRGKDRPILNDKLGQGFHDFLLAAFTPALARCEGAVYIAMSSSELDTRAGPGKSDNRLSEVSALLTGPAWG